MFEDSKMDTKLDAKEDQYESSIVTNLKSKITLLSKKRDEKRGRSSEEN